MKRYISVCLLVLSALAISAPALPGPGQRRTVTPEQGPPPESPISATNAVVRVLAVKDNAATADAYLKPDAGKKLIAVQIVVDNRKGTEELDVSETYFKLKDEEGGVYDVGYVDSSDQPTLKSGTVDPGDLIKGWITFQIGTAVKAKTTKLRYEFSDNKTAWIPLSSLVK